MAIALPYKFDTSPVVKLILSGVIGLLFLIVVPGIAYSLFVSHDRTAAVQLLLTGLIAAYFGRLFTKHLQGSRGMITSDAIVVEPASLYGIRLAGPVGRFPLQRFSAIQVERVPPPAWVQGGPHERVSVVGRDGTPDILIARTSGDAGRALGRDLALALGLSYQEESAPY